MMANLECLTILQKHPKGQYGRDESFLKAPAMDGKGRIYNIGQKSHSRSELPLLRVVDQGGPWDPTTLNTTVSGVGYVIELEDNSLLLNTPQALTSGVKKADWAWANQPS